MISSTTINTSSSSRHTVYNILIWNFNIDRIINLLSHLSKCTIKCLCLWNCTRESIKYISILTIFLVYSVYNKINNQFIRNQKTLIHESFCFLTKFCSVLDVCSKDISSRNMRNRILLSNLLCLCSFSCSWGS